MNNAESELSKSATTEDFSLVQNVGSREVQRMVKHNTLNAIILYFIKNRLTTP